MTGERNPDRNTSINPDLDGAFGVISALGLIIDPDKSVSEFPAFTSPPTLCTTTETPVFVILMSFGRTTLIMHYPP